ncbi:hypothetical protein DBR17_10690 [Sphingomonas sp. HMWF008]|nr:hypothetical protein DBR17_10690 [Sphingomonas sp. HMWF008]
MAKHFRLTSKSQVTVPLDVRMALGVGPGSAIVFDRDGDKIVMRKADEPIVDDATRRSERISRLERACRFARPMAVAVDDYMALIREPVPALAPE